MPLKFCAGRQLRVLILPLKMITTLLANTSRVMDALTLTNRQGYEPYELFHRGAAFPWLLTEAFIILICA